MSTLPTQLETTFRQIQSERMQGIPVVNEKLSVKATTFYPWKDYQLGILITPWFMNIMLLPNDKSANENSNNTLSKTPSNKGDYKVGATQNHVLPSGSYEFVTGYEESIGFFESCSLFSPMFDFSDQETAELTAKEALRALMDRENIDTASHNPSQEIEQIWSGEKPQPVITKNFDGSDKPSAVKKANKKPRKRLSERLKEPTSRRDFLRGSTFRDETATTEKQKTS